MREDESPASLTTEEVRDSVKRAFVDVDDDTALAFSTRFEPESVLGGRMLRFPMVTRVGQQPRILTVFANPGRVGSYFWTQEVRALLRLGSIGHAALPEILDGGLIETGLDPSGRVQELAFAVTGRAHATLGDPNLRAEMRSEPALFVRRLFRLADALVTLHRDGFLHRNIHPGAIEYDEDGDRFSIALRLSRFEMSSLFSDLLRLGIEGDEATARGALDAYLGQGANALVCTAPERLGYLFRHSDKGSAEHVAGDVYSLGVVAFQCLVAELDPTLIAAAFPDVDGRTAFDEPGWRRLHEWMVTRIDEASVGQTMRSILKGMIDPDMGTRFRSPDLLSELTLHDIQILEEITPTQDQQPWLVAVEPSEAGLLQHWGWISEQPLTSPAGRTELLEFIQEDLINATLEYAPDELTRHVRHSERKEEMAKGKYVLRGQRGYYFGHLYENRRPKRPTDPPIMNHVFMIRWILRRETVARDGGGNADARIGLRLAPIHVVWQRAESVTDPGGAGYRSWENALRQVAVPDTASPERHEFMGALTWLLRYQRAELEARQYAFIREDSALGALGKPRHSVRLRFDEVRDAKWRSRDAIRNLFGLSESRRPLFQHFFGADGFRAFDGSVRWRSDQDGAPDRMATSGVGHVEFDSIEPDCITVTLDEPGATIPSIGWIEPAEDEGQATAFNRQADASLRDLLDHPVLLAKLLRPTAFMRPGVAWEEAAENMLGASTPPVIRRMLASDSIYVLQGPPGTGKTTVVSRAVTAAIKADPSIRILVAAQSHYALDNLAIAIMSSVPASVLAVRLASESTETSVHDRVLRWTRTRLLQSRPEEVRQQVLEHLKNHDLQPEEREIVQRWYDTIPGAHADIVDRTYEGANLVFATCLQAIDAGPVVPGRAHSFDWVIVEEAAKALPSELAIPLVRGARWTLVGDHKQLPPYRLRELREFLRECRQKLREDRGLGMLLDGAEHFEKYFNLFGRFFDLRSGTSPTPWRVGIDRSPIDVLDMQFRMAPDIGTLVADTFYGGAVQNGRSDDHQRSMLGRAMIPSWIGEKRLVWLATDDEPFITNTGTSSEGEVTIVRRLVEEVWGRSMPSDGELAILTPYRKQCSLLRARLPMLADSIHTIDSFQGREADIVVASLVRGYSKRPEPTIYQKIGHLADEPRVNVMISRAREYLIMVGRFRHFHDAGRSVMPGDPGSHWATICRRFTEVGVVLPCERTGPRS